MKSYTWTTRLGFQYTVFAESVAEAKTFLRLNYHEHDLNTILFYKRAKIRKMPKAICHVTKDATWLYEKK